MICLNRRQSPVRDIEFSILNVKCSLVFGISKFYDSNLVNVDVIG